MIRIEVRTGPELRNVLKLWARGRLRRTVRWAVEAEARRLREAAARGHDPDRIVEASRRTPFDLATVRLVFEGAESAGLQDQDVEAFLERCAQANLAPLEVLWAARDLKGRAERPARAPIEDLELP